MRTVRNFLSLIALMAVVASCSNDDGPAPIPPAEATCTDGILNGDETAIDCGGSCKTCPQPPTESKDGSIDSQNDVDLDVNDLKGNVTVDITIAASEAWKLTGSLYVKDGATLTIEEGTNIQASIGGTDVFIAIEQGGKINAVGTAASPIKITSAGEGINARAGDWGGLLLAGRAPIGGPSAGSTATAEVGQSIIYGGSDAADNSGIIEYMILEYTGARINGTQEFNGFTFYAVGSGTSISNIAVFAGDDDGIEWFGGTVSVDNALVVNAKDDMFDWTEGWSGNGSNFFGLRTEDYTAITEDPRGIEADGNNNGDFPTYTPQSNPTITNITLIHRGINVQLADMIKIRRGSGATVTGAYVELGANSTASDFVDFTDGKGDAAASTTVTVIGNNIDITDVKPGANAGTINATEGTIPSVDAALFAWTGINLAPAE